MDANRNVYVADTGNDRIQKIAPDGAGLAIWGGTGKAPGQFLWPQAVVVDSSGTIYVADTNNNRVQVLSERWRAA